MWGKRSTALVTSSARLPACFSTNPLAAGPTDPRPPGRVSHIVVTTAAQQMTRRTSRMGASSTLPRVHGIAKDSSLVRVNIAAESMPRDLHRDQEKKQRQLPLRPRPTVASTIGVAKSPSTLDPSSRASRPRGAAAIFIVYLTVKRRNRGRQSKAGDASQRRGPAIERAVRAREIRVRCFRKPLRLIRGPGYDPSGGAAQR